MIDSIEELMTSPHMKLATAIRNAGADLIKAAGFIDALVRTEHPDPDKAIRDHLLADIEGWGKHVVGVVFEYDETASS